MGPNCVHESFDRGTVRAYPHATVYRTHHKVVWDGQGVVVKSNKKRLVVSELVLGDDGLEWVDVVHVWDGHVYR